MVISTSFKTPTILLLFFLSFMKLALTYTTIEKLQVRTSLTSSGNFQKVVSVISRKLQQLSISLKDFKSFLKFSKHFFELLETRETPQEFLYFL